MMESTGILEEQRLLGRLKAGDSRAYEELVRTYTPRLLALARRYLRTEEDALDTLQDAFVSVFKSIADFRGDSALGTWLHTVVVRAALMKLRARKNEPDISIDSLLPQYSGNFDHRLNASPAWSRPSDECVENREIRQLVRQSIDKLPEIYRVVLLMRDIDEYTTRETAQMLGLSEMVVKTRLHRARQALQTLLDPSLCRD